MNYPSIVLSAQPVLKPNWLRVICLILQIQNSTIPIVINRASPYYEKTVSFPEFGRSFSASVNTGMSTKEIDFFSMWFHRK